MPLSKDDEAALLSAQQDRTQAKAAVTRRVTRIANGITLEFSPDVLYKLLADLENTYSEFLDKAEIYDDLCTELNVDSTYLIVGGQDLESYKTVVREKFKEGRTLYNSHVNSSVNTSSAHSGQTAQSQPNQSAPSNLVYLKKQDPPQFSGLFKDFPEWDSLFEKMVVPNVPNKTALAYLLKKACENGPGF